MQWRGLESRHLLATYVPDVSFGSDGIIPVDPNRNGTDAATTVLRVDNNGLLVAVTT